MLSVQRFIDQTIYTRRDMDGQYGAQCWDYFAYFENLAGYPITYCTTSGYVKDIWNNRYVNGVLKNFVEVPKNKLQKGDWIIWVTSPYGTGNSHIAMFIEYVGQKVKVIGQNQDSSQKAIYGVLPLSGLGGCLRPDCWASSSPKTTINQLLSLQSALKSDGFKLDMNKKTKEDIQKQLSDIALYPYPNKSYNKFKNTLKFVQKKLGIIQDGSFGPNTKLALIAFQRTKGIKADGILNQKTLIELSK